MEIKTLLSLILCTMWLAFISVLQPIQVSVWFNSSINLILAILPFVFVAFMIEIKSQKKKLEANK